MEKYLEGLLIHDIILISLGTLMFLVLLVGLALLIYRKEPVSKLLLTGFGISALMIAYPSIQKIAFSNEVIKLEKIAKKVEENPTDSTAVKELEEQLEEVDNRPATTPNTLSQKSKSHYLVGNKEKARELADSALEKAPDQAVAKEIKATMELEESIDKMIKSPDDPMVKKEMSEKYKKVEGLAEKGPIAKRALKMVEPLSVELPPKPENESPEN